MTKVLKSSFIYFCDVLLFSLSVVPVILSTLIYCIVGVRKSVKTDQRKILVVDNAFSYRAIVEKQKYDFLLQRNLKGYFDVAYTLYPLLGANPFDAKENFKGLLRTKTVSNTNIFIEGKAFGLRCLSHFPRTNFIISQFLIIVNIRNIIRKEKINVIRAVDPFLTGLIAFVLSKMTSIPFTIRIGINFDFMYEKNGVMFWKEIFKFYWIEKALARYILPRASIVFGATQHYIDYCVNNGAKKETLVLCRFGNIIDKAHFDIPSKRPSIDKKYNLLGKRFAVYVGRLSPMKLPIDLLLVAEMVHNTEGYSDLKIVIIGDGELRQIMEKIVVEKNIKDVVLFLGNCKQDEIAAILPKACAYLSPHSGLSLLEAALAEIPLIAYDYEWHPELIKQGETGELIPFKNWKKMARALIHIAGNPSYGKILGVSARIHALEMMDQNKIILQEINAYKRILE